VAEIDEIQNIEFIIICRIVNYNFVDYSDVSRPWPPKVGINVYICWLVFSKFCRNEAKSRRKLMKFIILNLSSFTDS
jgi:hypothetical protein